MILFIMVGLLLLFFITRQYIDTFENVAACTTYTACETCANADGCSWCPEKNRCFSNDSSADEKQKRPAGCNIMNAISIPDRCSVDSSIPQLDPIADITDSLYKPLILDTIKPPNVYMTTNAQYTPETVMANVNDVRQEVQRYQTALPNVISHYVDNKLKQLQQ
jgi:hypothetical protein